MEDNLIVAYDCCPLDNATLCIARKEQGQIKILQTFRGEEAIRMYALLTDNTAAKI